MNGVLKIGKHLSFLNNKYIYIFISLDDFVISLPIYVIITITIHQDELLINNDDDDILK